jgi:PKD repeat protein
MRQKRLLLLFLAAFAIYGRSFAGSPPVVEWSANFGGSNPDFSTKILPASGGKMWLLGNTDSNNGDVRMNHGSTDIWLSQIDASGHLIKQFSFGGSAIDAATTMIEYNGQLVIAGYSASSNGNLTANYGGFDAWILCVDTNGTMLWEENYGGSYGDLAYAITPCNTGGFLITGGSFSQDGDLSSNHGNEDVWVFKIDNTGNLIWSETFGGSNLDIAYSIVEDNSGSIYVGGTTSSNDGDIQNNYGNYDWLLLKLSSSGNLIYEKTYGGSSYDAVQCMTLNTHQELVLGGYSRSADHDLTSNYGSTDCWLLKLNSSGTIVLSKQFGGTMAENLFDVKQTLDGGYVIVAGTTSNDIDVESSYGGEDAWLLKIDDQFHSEWNSTFGGSNNDRPASVYESASGEFYFSGFSFSNDHNLPSNYGNADLWLMKLNCNTPIASIFSPNSTYCTNDTIILSSTSSGYTYQEWNFENQVSSGSELIIIPDHSDSYSVTLNVQTCNNSNSATFNFFVNDCNLPTASFSVDNGTVCENAPVQFRDRSINATSWSWTFPGGNPSTSTDQNPIVTYSTAGVYSALLNSSNTNGGQTIMSVNCVVVHPNPSQPVITAIGNQLNSTMADSYTWYYNSNLISSAANSSYTANADGYYSVTVTNEFNCQSSSEPVYITVDEIAFDSNIDKTILIAPTVVHHSILIQLNSEQKAESIEVFDAIGRLVKKEKDPSSMMTMDLSEIASGKLFVVIRFQNGSTKKTILIKE